MFRTAVSAIVLVRETASHRDLAVHHSKRILAGLACCAAPLLIGAAKPTPTPAPTAFVPEIAYRYAGSAGTDVRLANAAGTTAVLLHRTPHYLHGFDLAPRSVQAAAISESTGSGTYRLVLRAWTQEPNGGAITVADEKTLYVAPAIYYPDFSPDGKQIAFTEWLGGSGTAAVYNVQMLEVSTGIVQTIAKGVPEPYYPVWSRDGDAIYYASFQPINGLKNYVAVRQPVAGGAPTVLFQKPRIGRWDISRDNTDQLIMTAGDAQDPAPRTFAFWTGSALTVAYPQLIGSSAHYACGNTKMIYTSYTRGGNRGPLKVFTPSTGADVVYSKDHNATEADWMPCG